MMINAITGLCLVLAFGALPDCSLAEDESCLKIARADIYMLADGSNSIYPVGFSKEKTFICNLARGVTVGPNNVQFAVGTFSTTSKHYYDLNTYSDVDKYCEGVNAIAQLKTNTDTAGAIDKVLEGNYLFDSNKGARNRVPKIVIIITDGQSDNTTATQIAAAKLRAKGVTIVTVGVGKVNIQELNGISGKPESALTVKAFKDIDTIKDMVYKYICEDTPEPVTATPEPVTITPCPQSNPVDIVFCVDSSGSIGADHFNQNRIFLKSLTSAFKIGPNDINIGAYVYGSNAYRAFKLSFDQDFILQALGLLTYRGSSTGTHKCIIAATATLKDGRPGVLKVLLTITDGKSDSPDETAIAATAAHTEGITCFAVGVGHGVSDDELQAIASDSKKVFKVESYDELQKIILDLAAGTCDAIKKC